MDSRVTESDVSYLVEKLRSGSYPKSDLERLIALARGSGLPLETRKEIVDGLSSLPGEPGLRALADVTAIEDKTHADAVVRAYALELLQAGCATDTDA